MKFFGLLLLLHAVVAVLLGFDMASAPGAVTAAQAHAIIGLTGFGLVLGLGGLLCLFDN